MTDHAPKLTLAIPALNESAIILGNIAELGRWMGENLPEIDFEILVIDDGSTDGMGDMLDRAASADPRVRVVHHPRNLGRGRAIRTAMENSGGSWLIALDADLSYSPDHIPALLAPLRDGTADVTLASPYHPEGRVENVPLARAWLSRVGNRILSRSFQSDISTVTCVVRGYTREVMDHLELVNDGKDLHLEVLYKAEILGFRIVEIPARLVWRDRKRGQAGKRPFGWLRDNPFVKMRKVIFSHVAFNFIAKPKLLFLGPIILSLVVMLYGTASLITSYFQRLVAGEQAPFRSTLVDGQLTLSLTLATLIISLVFFFFLFVASQAKQYFEEQYILSTRSHYLLKKLSRQIDAAKKN